MPPSKHAVLSASGAHRWLHCNPSARLELEFADRQTEAAAEGTAAHALAEHKLKKALKLRSRKPVSPYDCDEMDVHTDGYVEFVLEQLEEMGARCVNATCPNVLHIQRVVSRADEAGRIPLVIGEPHHPEVMGAASWSDRTLVFSGPEELEQWLLEDPGRQNLPLTAVAQTTCVRSIWESSKKF